MWSQAPVLFPVLCIISKSVCFPAANIRKSSPWPGDQTFKYSLGHLCFLCIEQETFAGGNLGLSVQSALLNKRKIIFVF